jgi:soluble lytic murein transglycosylase-like protein
MHPRSRTPLPPWERRSAYPRHPVGRARRRWPRAYDGGEGEVQPRYRRAHDREQRRERRRATRNRLSLDPFRQSPLRNGLIGLAVAGTAAPIAINRYQQALRTDPSHEQRLSQSPTAVPVSDSALSDAWQGMESNREAQGQARESTIAAKMEQYADFNLSREMAEDIYDMATAAEIEPDVAFGLVRAESSFKNTATSYVGAVGLTQLMPATAKWLEKGITNSELRNPETNLRIGFKYLKQLTEKYNGDTDLALVAYNRGPGTVDRILKRGGNPDNGYAQFVRTGDVGSHEL